MIYNNGIFTAPMNYNVKRDILATDLDAQMLGVESKYVYVVRENKEIYVVPIQTMGLGGYTLGHPDLADYSRIRFGGEIWFLDGRIVAFDNGSGHFKPHAKDAFQTPFPLELFTPIKIE